ncbi:MAG: acyl-CoA desaturase [Pseudomonadales bacterium]
MLSALRRWFDTESLEAEAAGAVQRAAVPAESVAAARAIDWWRIVPFVALHVACFGVLWVGISPVAVAVAALSYFVRMFAITAFYHRYFAHKAFRTSRSLQFLFAVLGAAATQRGPLWWAAHHREHHRHADQPGDPHRPAEGFIWSHMGWFLSGKNFATNRARVRDWVGFPELVWLNRFDTLVPIAYAASMFALGELLANRAPALGTDGWQMLVWGYFVSTVLLTHATLLVNSLAHVRGQRPFATRDDSRNNALIALLTLGEGWHNNHHRYAGSARQGFLWWQVDMSYYLLRLMAALGLVWDLKPVPSAVLQEAPGGRSGARA